MTYASLSYRPDILWSSDEALAEAAANYPDLWVAVQDMKKLLPGSKDTSADAVDAVTKPEIVPPPNTSDASGAPSSTNGPSNTDGAPVTVRGSGGSTQQLATNAGSGGPATPDDNIASPGPSREVEKQDASVDIISTSTD